MRLLYWLDYRLHSIFVTIGCWAWRKPHRPFIVFVASSVLAVLIVTGLLKVVDWTLSRT